MGFKTHIQDHGTLTGLSDDDHTQYSLVDGTRAFTGTVGGIDPVASTDLATKEYVDNAVAEVKLEYYLTDTASGVSSYYVAQSAIPTEAESSFSPGAIGTDTLIAAFITPSGSPALAELLEGVYDLHYHAKVASTTGTKTAQIYFELYTRTSGGVETLRATSENSIVLNTTATPGHIHATLSSPVLITATDRVLIKVYARISGSGANTTPTLYAEGTNSSSFGLPVELTAVNHGILTGLTADDHTQYLTTARHNAIDAADHGSGTATDNYVLTADGLGGAAWEAAAGGGASDHGTLTGLSDDDHTQYALLAGRTGTNAFTGTISATGTITATSAGSLTVPSFTVAGDTNSGLSFGNNDIISLIVGGNEIVEVTANQVYLIKPIIWTINGAEAFPAWQLGNGDATGIYLPASGSMGFSCFGVEQMRIKAPAGVLTGVGIGTKTPAATLSINGGCHVGGDTNPGDNNLHVDGTVGVGTSATSAYLTQGILLDQGAADDEILACRSSDVAHGMTTLTDTSTYFYIAKVSATSGGAFNIGFTEATVGLNLVGVATTASTTIAPLVLTGGLKSGTSYADVSAGNVVVEMRNSGTNLWRIFADGSVSQTGSLGVGAAASVARLDVTGPSSGASPVIVRQSDGTGGMALNAVGSFAGFALGGYWDGSAWKALLTSNALFYKTSDGYFKIYGDTGLTVGNSFTPTARYVFNLDSAKLGIGVDPAAALSVNGGAHIGGSTDPGDNNLRVDGTAEITGAFGCNATSPQTPYASGGALAAYAAGANGLSSGAEMAALHQLVVNIRLALVANGIMS